MSIQTEIAQRIDKALDGDCGYGVGGYLADQIAPLIAAHVAKVRAETLREAADKFEQNPDGEWGFWQDYEGWSMDPTEPLREEADRIEKEAGL